MKNTYALQIKTVEARGTGAMEQADQSPIAWLPSTVLICALGLLPACGKSNPTYSLLPTSKSFAQSASTVNNKIDVLWVVDNSGSMDPLQQNMTTNFSSFMTNFQSKGFDFQMAATTTDAYLATSSYNNNPQLAKFRDGVGSTHTGYPIVTPATPNLLQTFITNSLQGSNGSGDERAFQSLSAALASPLNSSFLRPGAFLAVVILSDEDDFTDYTRAEGSWVHGGVADHSYTNPNLITTDSFITGLDAITGSTSGNRHYNVSAITVLDNTCLNAHKSASPSTNIGQRYMDVANKTNGVLGSVCDSSYANSLSFIQQKIAELSTAFALDRQPVLASIRVYVNGGLVAQDAANGWTYDAPSNSIVFHGTGVPPASAAIQVAFDPVTIQ